jgi:hypothetical protein
MFGARQPPCTRLWPVAVLAALVSGCGAVSTSGHFGEQASSRSGASSPAPVTRTGSGSHHQLVELDLARAERSSISADGGLDGLRGTVETFAVIAADHPFREVLPSWNLDVPEGVHALVEVRVRRQVDGRWSPWLFVGEWGDDRRTSATVRSLTTEFDGGRVATDMVQADVALDAAQLRVVALVREDGQRDGHELPSRSPVVVRRATLCLSAGRVSLEAFGRPPGERAPIALDVPFHSQRDQDPEIAVRICSPTSVAMVLQYYGVEAEVDDVALRAFDPRHDIYGNWPRNVQAAWSFGVAGHLARFDDWSAVRACFERGVPLVVSIGVEPGQLTGAPYTGTSGHLIVLRGFDAAGDLLANDPAAIDGEQGRVVYAREELEQVWLARGGTAYVFEPL